MAGKDTLADIAQQIGLALSPLDTALTSEGTFSAFMRVLGWDTSGDIAVVKNLGSIVTNILNAVENGLDASEAANIIGQIVNLFSAVSQLSSASGLPGTIDIGEFQSDFPGQLVDYLVGHYLLNDTPKVGAILLAAGVIRQTPKPAAGKRPAYIRIDIAWNQLGDLLKDPLSISRAAYSWGGAAFDQNLFINNMATLGRAFGLTVFSNPVGDPLRAVLTQGATSTTNLQDYVLRCQLIGNLVSEADLTAGLDFYVLPPTVTAAPGIALLPYVTGSATETINISDRLSIILKAAFDLAGGILISIRPNQPVTLATGIFAGSPGSAAAFSVTLNNQDTSGAKQVLLGTEGASRLEYASLGITVGVRTDSQDVSFYTEAALTDGALIIAPGEDADGFLAKLLPDNFTVDASITVGFDSRLGLYFSGSGGLEIEIPAHISLGPIEIMSATIAVKPSGGAIPIELGATLQGNLGPLQAVVEDVGLRIPLTFPGHGGNLGPVNAGSAFLPPKGVGLSLNAGVVTGGGYLYIDADRGQYAGALQLEIAGFLSVAAIGLISTKMPDGSKGFSLLIIITADFGAGIQLSFGFTLLAVGGLLGLNRTVLFQPLMDGVRTGSIQSIMFPQDVIANAPRIISDLRAIFPPQEGTFLIGPMAKIGWGTPTLISLSLGVIIEIPPGDIAILGILKMALPAEALPILVLQVNFAGALEFDKQRFYFFASLVRLAHSVHHHYRPDGSVVRLWRRRKLRPLCRRLPSSVQSAAAAVPSAATNCYRPHQRVLCANSRRRLLRCHYQHGAVRHALQLLLRLLGMLGGRQLRLRRPYPVLAVPLHCRNLHAVFGQGVRHRRVRRRHRRQRWIGPTPWHVHGTASLSFFFFSIDIGIDFTWGDNPNTTLPPVAVMPILDD